MKHTLKHIIIIIILFVGSMQSSFSQQIDICYPMRPKSNSVGLVSTTITFPFYRRIRLTDADLAMVPDSVVMTLFPDSVVKRNMIFVGNIDYALLKEKKRDSYNSVASINLLLMLFWPLNQINSCQLQIGPGYYYTTNGSSNCSHHLQVGAKFYHMIGFFRFKIGYQYLFNNKNRLSNNEFDNHLITAGICFNIRGMFRKPMGV